MTDGRGWPRRLWIVRHGESAGNVARRTAHAAGHPVIDVAERDVDVPLSELGEQQALTLGRWFAAQPERPEVVLTSPYLRARRTAELVREAGGVDPAWAGASLVVDERLREKELGLLNRLTRVGLAQRYPEQVALRAALGKFYHRPPSGESWCDVILRLRSALDTLRLQHGGRRVLIVAHQVVVLCLRYVLEGLTEEKILAIDAEGEVANCSVTEYVAAEPGTDPDGGLVLRRYNFVVPLEQAGTPVTAEPAGSGGEVR